MTADDARDLALGRNVRRLVDVAHEVSIVRSPDSTRFQVIAGPSLLESWSTRASTIAEAIEKALAAREGEER